MKPFSASIDRLRLASLLLRGGVMIVSLLAIAALFVALGLVRSRRTPDWTEPSGSLSDSRAVWPGSGQRRQSGTGPIIRHTPDDGLSGNQGSSSADGFAAASGALDAERLGAAGRSDSPSSFNADAFVLAALERLERQIAAAMMRARESVVALEYTAGDAPAGTRRIATGVVINQRGEVLSVKIDPLANGVAGQDVHNATPILARDYSGRRHVAHWVSADPETGLTLLRVAPRVVRPIRVATEGPNLGGQVFVLGNPFGMGHSVSRGHIAGLDWAMELADRQLGGMIQIQAPLYPGDSGAAVVDMRGDLLGVIRSGLAVPHPRSAIRTRPNRGLGEPARSVPFGQPPTWAATESTTARLDQAERDDDFGFVIPARDALWVADQLHTCGRVDRAYLGVRLEGAPDDLAIHPVKPTSAPGATLANAPDGFAAISRDSPSDQRTELREGVLVEVLSGTPAAESGLRSGDRIVSVDGRPIRSAHDLTDRLDRILARTTIQLGVIRGRASQQEKLFLSLRTASRPSRRQAGQLEPTMVQPAPASLAASAPTVSATMTSAPSQPAPTGIANSPARSGASAKPTSLITASPSANVPVVESAAAPSPALRPNDLRLTLPRAVVERLELLERRLEKLESPRTTKALSGKQEAQVGSVRNP
jgi:S1-C subfamily serine protease